MAEPAVHPDVPDGREEPTDTFTGRGQLNPADIIPGNRG
jgi:hypothetical protein